MEMVRSKWKCSGFDFINLSSTSGNAKNKSAKYGKGAKKMHRKGKRGENA